jgi:hypothetical protein
MIYLMESEGRFPRRIKIGARAVGWLESEVQEWIAAQIRRSRPAEAVSRRPKKAEQVAAGVQQLLELPQP